jgi:hypothetical protein
MKFKTILIFIVFFFGVFVLVHSSLAAGDIYVSTTGNDTTGTGAIGSPLRTIAHAITHITDSNGGWNIILRGGTYYEHDIFIPQAATGTSGAWNTMRSYQGEWAKIDGQRSGGYARVLMNEWGNECSRIRQAEYWVFERLEITGGGAVYDPVPEDNGVEGAGIWWVRGPMKVRYCYIHDNLVSDAEENPAGISGTAWQGNLIEYNYFDNNGSVLHGVNGDQGGLNATTGISAMSCSEYNSYDINWEVRDNEFKYNYIKGYGIDTGIRTKGWTALTAARDGSDTSRRSHGDKVDHNIIESGVGIFYQQDGAQIYNNIINQSVNPHSGSDGYGNWSIATRRFKSPERDTLWPVIYNNTVVNGRDGIVDMHEGTSGAYWWAYNNIADSMSTLLYAPVAFGCSAAWCEYTAGSLDDTNVHIDRNYSYRNSTAYAVYIGDAVWNGGVGEYTLAQWEVHKPGTNLFAQASQESGSNKLYAGTSGANQYITVGTHNLGETGKTIANSGLGGAHPYLAGVTIPSYIGATNPNSNVWVAGVLGLAILSNLQSASSGDPTWIEGSVQPPADTKPPSAPSGLIIQ